MKDIEKITYEMYKEDHSDDFHIFGYSTFLTSDSYNFCYKQLAEKELRKQKLKLML